eukprot:5881840-Amphidinium_carterae.1
MFPHAIRELPCLPEEITYRFGGQEKDSSCKQVELSLVLEGQRVLKPVLTVLSGCACELPALLGRASLERELASVDCADRCLRFKGEHASQPLQ